MITIQAASNTHYLVEGINYSLILVGTLTEDLNQIQYSYDNGATWSSALASVPSLPIAWGESELDNWTARVTIPSTDQADIFPTVDGEVVRTNSEILFRAIGETSTVDSVSAVTFNLISGIQIKPDNNNTMSNPALDDTNLLNHNQKLHISESVNVIWETSAGTVDPDLEITAKIQWSGNAGLEYSISPGQPLYWGDGNKVVKLSELSYPGGAAKAYLAKIIITSANPLDPQIRIEGEYFCVTDKVAVSDAVTGGEAEGVAAPESYPQRTELYSRVALEKGIFMDEAVSLSQLEAGTGVIIRQRDHTGRKVGYYGEAGPVGGVINGENAEIYNDENPIDYAKAYNLVVEIDPSTLPVPARPRALQGIINFNTVGGAITEIDEADNQYGKLRKYVINHSWNLGDINDPDYKQYQTANSYHLEFMHVPSGNDETPFGWQYQDAVPLYATASRDEIEVYCVVKNANVAGLEPVLSKDRVVFGEEPNPSDDPVPSYIFEWRLVEVIPQLT